MIFCFCFFVNLFFQGLRGHTHTIALLCRSRNCRFPWRSQFSNFHLCRNKATALGGQGPLPAWSLRPPPPPSCRNLIPTRVVVWAPILLKLRYEKVKHKIFTIEYETVHEYFIWLRDCSKALNICGSKALLYFAAAVSDFYIPESEMAMHKIQVIIYNFLFSDKSYRIYLFHLLLSHFKFWG